MAVVLTLVQTKQIRMNIHEQNNTKPQYKQYKTIVNTSTHIPKDPHVTKRTLTHTHTFRNKLNKQSTS